MTEQPQTQDELIDILYSEAMTTHILFTNPNTSPHTIDPRVAAAENLLNQGLAAIASLPGTPLDRMPRTDRELAQRQDEFTPLFLATKRAIATRGR